MWNLHVISNDTPIWLAFAINERETLSRRAIETRTIPNPSPNTLARHFLGDDAAGVERRTAPTTTIVTRRCWRAPRSPVAWELDTQRDCEGWTMRRVRYEKSISASIYSNTCKPANQPTSSPFGLYMNL